MRQAIGCSATLAMWAFVPGLIGSLFAQDITMLGRLGLALMPAAMTFLAAILLFSRDHAAHQARIRAVQQTLSRRQDIGDQDWIECYSDVDPTLILQTRDAVGLFFDVPPSRIHPMDDLRHDLQFDRLEPEFHRFVISHIIAKRNLVLRDFVFNTNHLKNLGDLAREVQRVIDRLSQSGSH